MFQTAVMLSTYELSVYSKLPTLMRRDFPLTYLSASKLVFRSFNLFFSINTGKNNLAGVHEVKLRVTYRVKGVSCSGVC